MPVARRALNAALEVIQGALSERESVVLPGFGTFYVRTWPGGRVLDFATGATRNIGPRPIAAFRAGAITKRMVSAQQPKRRGRPRRRSNDGDF
jgi:nucleoid DNA-binding protein